MLFRSVYICSIKGNVSCLDIKTGNEIWSGQLDKNRNEYSSSPVLADGRIYISREDGKTFVLAQDKEFKVLAENDLGGEQTVATPVLVRGRILLRTYDHLYCIGK